MMDIMLLKDNKGFHVTSGQMRLSAALKLNDEVRINAPGFGEVLIVRLPDGQLIATQDTVTVALLGL